jgi:hypothetical protein
VDKIANVVENGDGSRMPESLRALFASNQAQEILAENHDDDSVRTASVEKRAKKTLPDALKEYQFKKKNEDSGDEDGKEYKDDDKDDKDDDVKQGKKASVRQRRIHFASAEQLSAEAVNAAKDAGDEELANTILAARHERRVRTAQRILDQAAEHAELQKKLAKRAEYRMSVVASAKAPVKTAAVKPNLKVKPATKVAAPVNGGFKEVSAMSTTEKTVIAQQYVSCGFPEAYVNEMLGINQPQTELPEDFKTALREIAASTMSDGVKRTVLSSMIKEANLTEEQRKRGEEYWTKDLPYVKDWADDLWSKAYDDDGSEDGATV